MYPQTRPTGKDEATAIRDDVNGALSLLQVQQLRIVDHVDLVEVDDERGHADLPRVMPSLHPSGQAQDVFVYFINGTKETLSLTAARNAIPDAVRPIAPVLSRA